MHKDRQYGVYKLGDIKEDDLSKTHRLTFNPNALYGLCMPADNPVAWCGILFETKEDAEEEAACLNAE